MQTLKLGPLADCSCERLRDCDERIVPSPQEAQVGLRCRR